MNLRIRPKVTIIFSEYIPMGWIWMVNLWMDETEVKKNKARISIVPTSRFDSESEAKKNWREFAKHHGIKSYSYKKNEE